MKSKMLDKKEVDAYLKKIGCGFCFIKRVQTSEKGIKGLADYLSDQNRKRRMAREMAYQSRSEKFTTILKWRWFGPWLPKGWTHELRTAWYRTMGMRVEDRLPYFKRWLLQYLVDPSVKRPDRPVTWDNEIGWIAMTDEEIEIWSQN